MLYTEDHHRLMASIRRFVAEEIDSHVEAWEAAETFPSREIFRKAGALGLFGITKPIAFGGSGLDVSCSVSAEEAHRRARADRAHC